jgi:hypothetical protein
MLFPLRSISPNASFGQRAGGVLQGRAEFDYGRMSEC